MAKVFIWEEVDSYSSRARVFGGWIVKTKEPVYHPTGGQVINYMLSTCFVPDPDYQWHISTGEKKKTKEKRRVLEAVLMIDVVNLDHKVSLEKGSRVSVTRSWKYRDDFVLIDYHNISVAGEFLEFLDDAA